jgi:hypothetical protein
MVQCRWEIFLNSLQRTAGQKRYTVFTKLIADVLAYTSLPMFRPMLMPIFWPMATPEQGGASWKLWKLGSNKHMTPISVSSTSMHPGHQAHNADTERSAKWTFGATYLLNVLVVTQNVILWCTTHCPRHSPETADLILASYLVSAHALSVCVVCECLCDGPRGMIFSHTGMWIFISLFLSRKRWLAIYPTIVAQSSDGSRTQRTVHAADVCGAIFTSE